MSPCAEIEQCGAYRARTLEKDHAERMRAYLHGRAECRSLLEQLPGRIASGRC